MDEKDYRDLKKLVEKTHKLSEDNNKMLRKMRRSMVWGSIFRSLYWIFIIASVLGVYYYLQPFLGQAQGGFQTIFSGFEALQGMAQELQGFDLAQ